MWKIYKLKSAKMSKIRHSQTDYKKCSLVCKILLKLKEGSTIFVAKVSTLGKLRFSSQSKAEN